MSKGNILLIIAQRNFRDEEFSIPKKVFEDNDYKVDIASESTEKARGKFGLVVSPDISIEESIEELDKYSAIVFSGGPGALNLLKREEVLELLKVAKDEDKIIGAICVAPIILANAGLLKNKKATVWSSEENQETIFEIQEKGAKYTDAAVVADRNIITANGPDSAKEFAEKILETVGKNG